MFSLKNSTLTSQSSSNGGRFTLDKSPVTLVTEKLTSVTPPYHDRLIKRFVHNESETNETNVAVSLENAPSGDYAIFLALGDQVDTQGTFLPTRYYSAGLLTTAAAIGDTQLTVQFPQGSHDLSVAQAGDILVLMTADKSTTHHVTIDSITFASDIATIQLIDPLSINWAVGSIISSAITAETITSTINNSSMSGCSIDIPQILVTNDAAIEQSFLLTFTSSTDFTVSGDTIGALPNGSISTQYAPLNPATNTPYFTIPSAAWSSAATAATVTFDSHPSALPIWFLSRFYPGATADTYLDAASIIVSQF